MCTALYVHKCPRLIVPKARIKSCIIVICFKTKNESFRNLEAKNVNKNDKVCERSEQSNFTSTMNFVYKKSEKNRGSHFLSNWGN